MQVGKPKVDIFSLLEISFVISGVVKYPAKSIPKNDTVTIIFDIIFSEIFLRKPKVADKKIIRNIANPYQQAGYPKKYGQVSLKAQVEVKSFIALKYPENNKPPRPRKNIVFE